MAVQVRVITVQTGAVPVEKTSVGVTVICAGQLSVACAEPSDAGDESSAQSIVCDGGQYEIVGATLSCTTT